MVDMEDLVEFNYAHAASESVRGKNLSSQENLNHVGVDKRQESPHRYHVLHTQLRGTEWPLPLLNSLLEESREPSL